VTVKEGVAEQSVARKFKPGEFDLIGTARKDPNSPWMQTEKRMPNMALFLSTWDSFPLKDAIEIDRAGTPRKDGKDYLSTDADTLKQGKIVFADNCASCHSGKKPNPMPADSAQQKQAWRDLVLRDDFLVDNYLSDDQRHPLSELGTNAQRAMGTNAMGGHTWGQMSSQTYKDERVPTEPLQDQDANGKPIPLYDPLTGKNVAVPPSGHMSGIYARVDNARGVHKAPANETIAVTLTAARRLCT